MISYTTSPNHYVTAKDLLAEDDHIEMDVNVSGWSHSLRIRSLTVPQRNRINAVAGLGEKRDWTLFYAHTIAEGVVRPKLNPAQARELVEHHNGEPVEELCEAIWGLGSLHTVYQRYREELNALNADKEKLPEQERDSIE